MTQSHGWGGQWGFLISICHKLRLESVDAYSFFFFFLSTVLCLTLATCGWLRWEGPLGMKILHWRDHRPKVRNLGLSQTRSGHGMPCLWYSPPASYVQTPRACKWVGTRIVALVIGKGLQRDLPLLSSVRCSFVIEGFEWDGGGGGGNCVYLWKEDRNWVPLGEPSLSQWVSVS